jgi:hypothetical protein
MNLQAPATNLGRKIRSLPLFEWGEQQLPSTAHLKITHKIGHSVWKLSYVIEKFAFRININKRVHDVSGFNSS